MWKGCFRVLVPWGRGVTPQGSRQLGFEMPRIHKLWFLKWLPSMYSPKIQWLARVSGDFKRVSVSFSSTAKRTKGTGRLGQPVWFWTIPIDNLTKHPPRKSSAWVCLYNLSQNEPDWKCFATWTSCWAAKLAREGTARTSGQKRLEVISNSLFGRSF